MAGGSVCDGRCWRALEETCRCWCRGLYHGRGPEVARAMLAADLGLEPRSKAARKLRGVSNPADWGPLFAAVAPARALERTTVLIAEAAQIAKRLRPKPTTRGD